MFLGSFIFLFFFFFQAEDGIRDVAVTGVQTCALPISLGVRNVQFHEMDAERLTFADLTFDRVVCRFGLMLMPAAERALAEMHRVLVPGGRIGVAVWSAQSKVNTLGIVRRALERHDAFHPPPGAPDLFRFGKAGAMERALRKAGFRHVRSERVTAEWGFNSLEEVWNSMKQSPSLRRGRGPRPPRRRPGAPRRLLPARAR